MTSLPPLIEKALTDAGYDLLDGADDGWIFAHASGAARSGVYVKMAAAGAMLRLPTLGLAERLGMAPLSTSPPSGLAVSAPVLFRALRALQTLDTYPAQTISARIEARLAAIPATERTREVRERIGQDVFREALLEFWDGRCALSGQKLPAALLRASHVKPWAHASDDERLDPFNGLLLAVQYDALFDQGLISFADDGGLLISARLDAATRNFIGLRPEMRLQGLLPGHLPYLCYHRERVASDARGYGA